MIEGAVIDKTKGMLAKYRSLQDHHQSELNNIELGNKMDRLEYQKQRSYHNGRLKLLKIVINDLETMESFL